MHAGISIGVDLSPVRDIDQSLYQRIAATDHDTTAEAKAFQRSLNEFIGGIDGALVLWHVGDRRGVCILRIRYINVRIGIVRRQIPSWQNFAGKLCFDTDSLLIPVRHGGTECSETADRRVA